MRTAQVRADPDMGRGDGAVSPVWVITNPRTSWRTEKQEQFELTTFTPASLRRLFEKSGFEVLLIAGKTIVPIRDNKRLLAQDTGVERLLHIEQELSKDPCAAARAGHLQITARRTQ